MRKMNRWLLVGIVGVAVFGSQFGIQYGRAIWSRDDMWWTPKTMALPLDATRQEFEMYVNDELLQSHLQRGSLAASGPDGLSYRVNSDQIVVRLNNWHKVEASFLHSAVFLAFFLGICLTSLVVGVIQLATQSKMVANQTDGGDTDQPA